jgi:predicted transcriptional regulator
VYESDEKPSALVLVADIVAAYVSNNAVAPADVGALISSVHGALTGAASPAAQEAPAKRTPFVSVRKSVTPVGITCLFDGQTFKTLKRHLLAAHGLTPDEYRQTWGLDSSYPMVSEATSKMRSDFAKSIGLGAGVGKRKAKPAAKARKPKA